FDRVDLAVIVAEAGSWGAFEEALAAEFRGRSVPVVAVINKIDLHPPESPAGLPVFHTDAIHMRGIDAFREALLAAAPADCLRDPAILGDLVGPGELAVLVVPIDKEAPKGRLILPQVQAIRDLLDSDSLCMVVKERELRAALERLKIP